MSPKITPPEWLLTIVRSLNTLCNAHALPDDGLQVLGFLDLCFPGRAEVALAQARFLLLRKDHAATRAVLSSAEALHPRDSGIKAMTALCLYSQGDALWESYAEEAAGLPPSPIARMIVAGLAKSAGKQFGIGAANAPAGGAGAQHLQFQGMAC